MRNLGIEICPADDSIPDVNLDTEFGWVCSSCGHIAESGQDSLIVFEKVEGLAFVADGHKRNP